MSRSPSALGVLFRNEVRMLLRDTRTILIAVLAPLILFPMMAIILNAVENRDQERLEQAIFSWALVGDTADWARPILERALANRSDSSLVGFVEQPATDAGTALAEGDLNLLVRARELDGEPPSFVLEYRGRSDFSQAAAEAFRAVLSDAREDLRDSVFSAAGFPVARGEVAVVETQNVATQAQEAGAFLGLALTPFLILLMLGGGSIVAADAISGEKERGTLETLLTSAASRKEIVRAKLLAVVVVGLAVAVINVTNLLIYSTLGLIDLPSQLAVSVSLIELLGLLVLILPITVLVGSALLLLSGVSKSYKEYQTYFFPVFLIFLVPSMAALLPGMELRSAIVFVPIAGIGVAIRDLLLGDLDLLFGLFALVSTAGTALWLTRVTERTLSNERLISNAGLDEADLVGGPALFPRHVLAWFLGFWVIFFVTALWFGETLGVRGQLVVNLVVIFFGGSVLVARRYRLPFRATFNLKGTHPLIMAVVLIGAPSALVLGLGISEFVNTWLFPVPQGMAEAMEEGMGLDMSLGQLLFFLALMPAIFEEFAFRGLLVSGLRGTRLPRWGVVLLGGLIFGAFHVSLSRIFPTAWLGMNLVVVVLLTRSLWPAVLWHFLNNAIALWASKTDLIDAETFVLPAWTIPAAMLGLALTWWVMARFGRATPAPVAAKSEPHRPPS